MFKNNLFKVNVDTVKWLKASGIRAVKTMAQTAVALIPVAVNVNQIDWLTVLGTAVTAGAISLLTSVAGIPEVESEAKDADEQ